jgi:hypothetical protein
MSVQGHMYMQNDLSLVASVSSEAYTQLLEHEVGNLSYLNSMT